MKRFFSLCLGLMLLFSARALQAWELKVDVKSSTEYSVFNVENVFTATADYDVQSGDSCGVYLFNNLGILPEVYILDVPIKYVTINSKSRTCKSLYSCKCANMARDALPNSRCINENTYYN
ncbi:MAG: hypothetical protein LBT56_02885 [Prevotellaceae bacterium]|jgi:hypothetical protein|nr:hypothetical protein [Prevotellaceae bacterium]